MLLFVIPGLVWAQSAVNYTGNGGKHTIQGRIYVADGRRAGMAGLKIRLVSIGTGDLSVFADSNGTFAFKNIIAGSYSVVVDDSDTFEANIESVYIDDPGSSNVRGSIQSSNAARIFNVQIYLRPKAPERSIELKNEVVNAKWADIPKETLQHYERGLQLELDHSDGAAEMEFRKAIALSPAFAPAYTELGKLALKTGKLDASIDWWTTAIRYDKSDFDAHLDLGIAFLNLKKYGQAETELVTAAFLNRSAVTPHYYLGMMYVMKNDLDIARKAFETALQLKGGNSLPAIHKYLARIYVTKQMNKEAVLEFQAYLDALPTARDAEKVRKDILDLKNRQE